MTGLKCPAQESKRAVNFRRGHKLSGQQTSLAVAKAYMAQSQTPTVGVQGVRRVGGWAGVGSDFVP